MMIAASTTLIVASIIGSASAFVAPVVDQRCSSPALHATKKSQAIPFVNCPPFLDGSMAGDVGFDPFGFAKSEKDLKFYRAAEVKHARLAMLAAAGWPISELFDRDIANTLGLPSVLDAANRVPSVLNGGMGKISPIYWGVCIALVGAVDVYGLTLAKKNEDFFIGDLGLKGFYPQGEKGQKRMQLAEIKNGRLAMIAITAFAFQEFATHIAVIDQTPFFFYPIWETVFGDIGSTHGPGVVGALDAATTAAVDAVSSTPPPTQALEAVTTAAVEATTQAATAVVPPVVDAVSAVPAVVSPPVVDAVVSTPTPIVNNEELIAAQKRIAELELKLSTINNLLH